MDDSILHHVSLPAKNLPRARTFYMDVLGFHEVDRPKFSTSGAWLRRGRIELHLIDLPTGSFRNTTMVGTDDVHFAMRVHDFAQQLRDLEAKGYREDLPDDDAKRIMTRRMGIAGYSQLYVMDADFHLIEINGLE